MSYLYPPPSSLLFSFSPSFKNIPAAFILFFFFLLFVLQLSCFFFLLDSRTFVPNIVQSSSSQSSWPSLELSLIFDPNAVQTGQMAFVFYLLSFFLLFLLPFFFFFCFYCYDLINFKIMFLSLYSDNLIMLEFRDV